MVQSLWLLRKTLMPSVRGNLPCKIVLHQNSILACMSYSATFFKNLPFVRCLSKYREELYKLDVFYFDALEKKNLAIMKLTPF